MNQENTNGCYGIQEVKPAAQGRWADIIPALTSVSTDLLDGKHHGCPKCGEGEDRFRTFEDFSTTGGLFCNQCHNGNTEPKSGDGIAAVQWLNDSTFPEALKAIAEYVGIAPDDPANDTQDIIGDLCKQKNMPRESAIAYGAELATRGGQEVVRFPVVDCDGNATSYSDVSPFVEGKLNKGMLRRGGKGGLHLPDGRLPECGETWLLVEGVKDAAALHGLGYLAAGVTGCNLANDKREQFGQLFSGCNLILIPDLDHASLRGFHNIGESFAINATSVSVALLPGEVKPTKGDDVRDIIQRYGEGAVQRTINQPQLFGVADLLGGRKPVYIDIDRFNEQEVANRVIGILVSRGFTTEDIENRIYQRAGKLVVVADTDTGPRILPIDETGIRERITAAIDLITCKSSSDGIVEILVRPPCWLCKAIHARPTYDGVRRLDGIVTAPTMRADGSILQITGYDAESRLLYLPDGDYPKIPEFPTQGDAQLAVTELRDIVADFPFPDDTARAVWVALVLTLLGRSAIVGNVPLFSFSANIRGSGKSKLCDLAGLIAFGRTMARKILPGNDDETRKVITAIAIEAKSAVLLDNAVGMIGNASLDAVLTSETWNDRILGKSETTGDLPWRTVLMVTGNNLTYAADTARRVILCQLECLDETPEDRDDFQHANIEVYTLDNRHRLVVAALTILRAYVVAERPYAGKRLGSFEQWSELICGAVMFAGLPNPLKTVSIVREQDNTGTILRMLLDGIATVGGVDGLTSKEIKDGIDPNRAGILNTFDNVNMDAESKAGWEVLRAAFAEITDRPTTHKIGNELKKHLGRVSGGRRLINKSGRSNAKRWAVEFLDAATDLPDVPASSEFEDVGNCNQCGGRLTATPTADGFLNRHCDKCDKDFRCVPMNQNSEHVPPMQKVFA